MRKGKILAAAVTVLAVLAMLTFTVSAEDSVKNGWYHDKGYYEYFENDYQYKDGEYDIDGSYFRFDSDGKMYNNEWYQNPETGDWYYYQPGGYRADDCIAQYGDYYYGFDWNGVMYNDAEFGLWSYEQQKWFYYRAGVGGPLYRNAWYKEYNSWYYYGDDCSAPQGLTTMGSTTYYFTYWGRMLADQADYDSKEGCSYYADKNGNAVKLNPDTWTKVGDDFFYCVDGEVVRSQIKEIGNSSFYFEYSGKMLKDEEVSFWNSEDTRYRIRAKADGYLYCGEWYLDGNSYSYYGYDCKRVENGFEEIGGSLFRFEDGYALQDSIFEIEDGVYVAASNCAVTKCSDGWISFKKDFYYVSDNRLVRHCIMEIGGSKYAFEDSGRMYKEGVHWIYDGEYGSSCYLINDTGAIVTEQGWKQYDGQWYYVTEDSTLYEGELELNGVTYSLWPALEYSSLDFMRDENNTPYLYWVMPDGSYQKITTDGYYNTPYGKVLVENGALFEGWKQIGESWYYFAPGMFIDGRYYVKDDIYYFDNAGVMQANGWIPYADSYMYADEYGRLADGVVTVGDKEYLFRDHSLAYSTYANYNGAYVSDQNAFATKIEDNGWSFANGYWYYAENGNVKTNDLNVGEDCYYFDGSTGRMVSNCEKYNCYYDEYGRRYIGWKAIDGSWYYFEPYKVRNGVWKLDENEYCFDQNGKMLSNTTYFLEYSNKMVVTDAYGIVVDQYYVPDGIVYQNGSAYMYKDGNAYNGWYGEWYFRYGRMVIEETISEKGNYYYLDNHGKYIHNGWHQRYSSWIYADEYGSLCRNEWLQLGNAWYYFDYIYMVSDGIYYIEDEDKYAEFDEYGRFISYVDIDENLPTGAANSWANIDGKWYYYNSTGTMVTDDTLYLNGYWYMFGGDGAMISDEFYFDWNSDYYSEILYYYTASGARLEAPNQWKIINGDWCYFNADSSVAIGWINISGTRYYIGENYDYDEATDEETYSLELYTGYRLIGGKVYYFNAGGDLWGEYVGNGWLQLADGGFVYFKDGQLLKEGVYNIDGVDYYFYHNGLLLTDGYCYASNGYNEYSVYASESGALYGAGWHLTNDGWIYVDESGKLYVDGVYKIGNGVYFFDNCYMV